MKSQSNRRDGATKDDKVTFPCPACGKPSIYTTTNPVRPFCSVVCKTGDLAAWASDSYKIPTNESPTNEDHEGSEAGAED